MFRFMKTTNWICAFGMIVFMTTAPIWADVITIEGVIKSVDAKDRSITVTKTTKGKAKDIDLEVDKKAKISLEGKGADFSSLRPGQKAAITFESELGVVTKIEATDSGALTIAGKEISERRLNGHLGPVLSIEYSPSQDIFASGSSDGTIRVWNTYGNDEVVSVLTNSISKGGSVRAGISQVAFSPDGKILVAGSLRGSLNLWDMTTEKPKLLKEIPGRSGPVTALAFSKDGKLFASNERHIGLMRLWDSSNNDFVSKDISSNNDHEIWSLAFSPNDDMLLAGVLVKGKPAKGELWLWDVKKLPLRKKVLVETDNQPRGASYSPDGSKIAFGDGGVVRIVDSLSGKQVGILDCTGGMKSDFVISTRFSPCGKLLATCGYDGNIRIWEVGAWNLIRTMQGADSGKGLEQVAFSPDGKVLVSCATDSSVRVWNVPVEKKKK